MIPRRAYGSAWRGGKPKAFEEQALEHYGF